MWGGLCCTLDFAVQCVGGGRRRRAGAVGGNTPETRGEGEGEGGCSNAFTATAVGGVRIEIYSGSSARWVELIEIAKRPHTSAQEDIMHSM